MSPVTATCSSLLPMLPRHEAAAPYANYVDAELVLVKRLDDVARELIPENSRPFLKMDTQGFERQVLSGAGSALDGLLGVQLEMSLVPLYENGMLYQEAVALLTGLGFTLTDVIPGFRDPNNRQLLQMDGIFFRLGLAHE